VAREPKSHAHNTTGRLDWLAFSVLVRADCAAPSDNRTADRNQEEKNLNPSLGSCRLRLGYLARGVTHREDTAQSADQSESITRGRRNSFLVRRNPDRILGITTFLFRPARPRVTSPLHLELEGLLHERFDRAASDSRRRVA